MVNDNSNRDIRRKKRKETKYLNDLAKPKKLSEFYSQEGGEEEKDINELRKKYEEIGLLKKEVKKKKKEDIGFVILSLLNSASLTPLANRVFSKIQYIYPSFFEPLKELVEKSDVNIPPDTYIGYIFGIAFVLISVSFGAFLGAYFALSTSLLLVISGFVLTSIFVLTLSLSIGYLYPMYLVDSKKKSIENNLPFAINHLAAISYASVPLDKAFKMLLELGDYGGVTSEIKKIVRRVDVFGEDIIDAIHYVAAKTPSENFRTFLFGITSIVESGGNLREYLREMSEMALFNYRIERKKYLDTLSTYADIYTAIIITAPLFLVSVLAVINVVPNSKVMGYDPLMIMKLGVYVFIPAINLIFLLFLGLTQPEV